MRTWIYSLLRRLIVLILGGALIAGGVALGLDLGGMLWPSPELAARVPEWTPYPGLSAGLISAGAAILGLALTVLAIVTGSSSERWWTLTQGQRAGGTVNISVSRRSIESLVAYAGQRVDGVRLVRPKVRLGRKGWTLSCIVELWGQASIIKVGDALRERIPAELEAHTGLPVLRLDLDLVRVMDSKVR